jgi:hypothetical protein
VEGRAPLVVLQGGVGPALEQYRDELEARSRMDRSVQRGVPIAIHCITLKRHKKGVSDRENTRSQSGSTSIDLSSFFYKKLCDRYMSVIAR